MGVHYSSESPEWYTPRGIIERVERTFRGPIDLDPCSNSKTATNVPAIHYLTRKDDGLQHRWTGRVYMNPPYGREIADWVAYLCQQYEARHTTEAIALLPARTDTEWFTRLRTYPRCFVRGRLSFSEHQNSAPFPSMAVYLGKNVRQFIRAFRDLGDIFVLAEQDGLA